MSNAGIFRTRAIRALVVGAGAIGLMVAASGPAVAVSGGSTAYHTVNLVSDRAGVARFKDPNLVNAWGLVASATSPWWVANNGSGTSTLYNGSGVLTPPGTPLVVKVPGGPTGEVFNGTTDFAVSSGGATAPARFLFATEEGTIVGWNPTVPAAGSKQTFELGHGPSGAIFKGLAIGASGGKNYLYATDFGTGKVEVFRSDGHQVTLSGHFADPTLPSGYAPFGIQAIGDNLFVTFARKSSPTADDETAGAGLGYVDQFSMDGHYIHRVGSKRTLNAPWGIAMAPANGFGQFGGDLIVGNFGDGRLTAFHWDGHHWTTAGLLMNRTGHPVAIDGLWAIEFGHGKGSGPLNYLYFTAGPNDESHGLFGVVHA